MSPTNDACTECHTAYPGHKMDCSRREGKGARVNIALPVTVNVPAPDLQAQAPELVGRVRRDWLETIADRGFEALYAAEFDRMVAEVRQWGAESRDAELAELQRLVRIADKESAIHARENAELRARIEAAKAVWVGPDSWPSDYAGNAMYAALTAPTPVTEEDQA